MKTTVTSLVAFLAVALGGVAHANDPGSVEIASCKFKKHARYWDRICRATASVCLGTSVTNEQCQPRLKVWCDDDTIYRGTWVPSDQENPPLYVLHGRDSRRWDEVKIEISPQSRDENPSFLFFGDYRLRGNCKMAFDLWER